MTEPHPLDAMYEPLAVAVRRLIDVTIRTEADAATVLSATHLIDEATEQLGVALMPGSFGVRTTPDGRVGALGNAVIGTRNPVAPPLVVHDRDDGRVWSEFVLGPQYEGPAGHVHGGICALILDHVLGATAHQPGRPAVTGTLTLRYLRGTRLGPLRAEAWVDRVEGAKTFAVGEISDAEGVTVRAEGVFIHPRARPAESSVS